MSNSFLSFENGKISLNNQDLLVNSARLSIATNLQPEKVYGSYDESIRGAKTEFVNFNPMSHLKGQLEISFYVSSDVISPNSVNRLFELVDVANPDNSKTTISEAPINGNIVGRYIFDNMYLTSFSFNLSPFQLIVANATYDIYGSINKVADGYFQKQQLDPAHSMKSFGEIKINNQESNALLEVMSFAYNINVERKISNTIRANENLGSDPYGLKPSRVSVESIVSEASITCNEMVEKLNAYGDQQNDTVYASKPDSSVDIFLYGIKGERLSRFRCSGKIQNQSYSIQEGAHASSSISIKQIIK